MNQIILSEILDVTHVKASIHTTRAIPRGRGKAAPGGVDDH